MSTISRDEFSRRFLSLVLNQTLLPKKRPDLHLLLYSATLSLQPERRYSEKEINEQLQTWCLMFGKNMGLDYVSLRRALVDEGFLHRDPSGSHYTLDITPLNDQFDPEIRSLDLLQLATDAIEEKERRKQEFLNRQKG
jgi:hypothetical protein